MKEPFKGWLGLLDTKAHVAMAYSCDRKEGILPNSALHSCSWSLQTDSTSLDPSLNIFFSHHWALSILMCFGKKLCFHQQGICCASSWECSQWAQHLRILLHLSLTLWDLGRVIYTQKESGGKLGASDHYSQFLQAHTARGLESWCFSFALFFPTSGKLYSSLEG